jgi:hypothetical protein
MVTVIGVGMSAAQAGESSDRRLKILTHLNLE